MGSRLDLQKKLEDILGSRQVYFQQPTNMKYPAIVYELKTIDNDFANDTVYASRKGYNITLIDANPDSPFVDILNSLPTSKHDRHFKNENLNHYVFTLYF